MKPFEVISIYVHIIHRKGMWLKRITVRSYIYFAYVWSKIRENILFAI